MGVWQGPGHDEILRRQWRIHLREPICRLVKMRSRLITFKLYVFEQFLYEEILCISVQTSVISSWWRALRLLSSCYLQLLYNPDLTELFQIVKTQTAAHQHPNVQEYVEKMFNMSKAFFALPNEQKADYKLEVVSHPCWGFLSSLCWNVNCLL